MNKLEAKNNIENLMSLYKLKQFSLIKTEIELKKTIDSISENSFLKGVVIGSIFGMALVLLFIKYL